MKNVQCILLVVLLGLALPAFPQETSTEKETIRKQFISLAKTYRQKDSTTTRDQAVEFYRKAIEADPENPENIKLDVQIALRLTGEPFDIANYRKQVEYMLSRYSLNDYLSIGDATDENSSSILLPHWVYNLSFHVKDNTERRAKLQQCLDMLEETHTWRVDKWLNPIEHNTGPFKNFDGPPGPSEETMARQKLAETGIIWTINEATVRRIASGGPAIATTNLEEIDKPCEALLVCCAAGQYALSYPEGEERVAGLTQLKAKYPKGSPVEIAIGYAIAEASDK